MIKQNKKVNGKILRKEKTESMIQGVLLGAGLTLAAAASYKIAKTVSRKYRDFKESPSRQEFDQKVQDVKNRLHQDEQTEEELDASQEYSDNPWDEQPLYSIDMLDADIEKALAEKPFCLDLNELHKIAKAWDEGKAFDIEYVNTNGFVTIRLVPEDYDDLDEEMPESKYLN
jgi:hypothetical protein